MAAVEPGDPSRSPYFPLVSVVQHLEILEGLYIRDVASLLNTRDSSAATHERARRRRAHTRCLELRREETIREASLRLRSRHFATNFIAARTLLEFAPDQCIETSGGFTIRASRPLALAAALADAGVPRRPEIGDDLSVEAYSARADVPEGMLIGHLMSRTPRAGLVAAARSGSFSKWTERTLIKAALGSSWHGHGTRYRALALYALGRSSARKQGCPDPAFASLVDARLGDTIFDATVAEETGTSAGALLIVSALVGHIATARRVTAWMGRHGPAADCLYALGVLGIPACAEALIASMSADDPWLRHEAGRAMYLMTGEWFVKGDRVAEDGRNVEPDAQRAHDFLRSWSQRGSFDRYHLGRPLQHAVEGAPPSFAYLRAILSGESGHLGRVLLPGVLDGAPRRRGSPYSMAAPVRGFNLDPPRRVSIDDFVSRARSK